MAQQRKPRKPVPTNPANSSPDNSENVVVSQRFFQGPLPPPDALKDYEHVKEGFADRILKMAENEQLMAEREQMHAHKFRYHWLYICAFIIICTLTAITVLVINTSASISSWIVPTSLVGGVVSIVYAGIRAYLRVVTRN